MTEREQIWVVLQEAGIDHSTPTKDGKTALEWMSESCPSLSVAKEFARRLMEGDCK